MKTCRGDICVYSKSGLGYLTIHDQVGDLVNEIVISVFDNLTDVMNLTRTQFKQVQAIMYNLIRASTSKYKPIQASQVPAITSK